MGIDIQIQSSYVVHILNIAAQVKIIAGYGKNLRTQGSAQIIVLMYRVEHQIT